MQTVTMASFNARAANLHWDFSFQRQRDLLHRFDIEPGVQAAGAPLRSGRQSCFGC